MSGIHRLLAAALFSLGLLSGGCGTSIKGLKVFPRTDPEGYGTPDAEKVQVQYLGVGGFLVRRGDDAILFAPSFTNPPIPELVPGAPIHSDEALVERCLEQARTDSKKDPLADVQFILVGHSHYDHLLDVPYVMQHHATQALVLGSRTTHHILAGAALAGRTLVVDDCAARLGGAMGRWIYNAKRTVRVLALESEHSPHLQSYKLMQGHYSADRATLPDTAFGWKEGQTYAYLVDFLKKDAQGQERVDFRIHYQDAASRAAYALIPQVAKRDAPRVDLAITCVGAYGTAETYPVPQLRDSMPRHVVLGHWEDFFNNQRCDGHDREARVVMLADIHQFISRVEQNKPDDARWAMPYPYSTMYFPRAGSESSLTKSEECPVRPGDLPSTAPLMSSFPDWPL